MSVLDTPTQRLLSGLSDAEARLYICAKLKKQGEQIERVHDLIVGTGDRAGMAEVQREHTRRLEALEAVKRNRKAGVWGAMGAAIVGAGVALKLLFARSP
jgi:hypothetical protein